MAFGLEPGQLEDRHHPLALLQLLETRCELLWAAAAEVVERSYALKLAGGADNLSEEERRRIQTKQGGHHMLLQPEDDPTWRIRTAIQTRS